MLLLIAVAAAKELRMTAGVQEFIRRHPGTGFAVQHFFNLFLMTFIVRAGA